MIYKKRLIDQKLLSSLGSIGAVFLRGVKACGKTESALRLAKSSVNLQSDPRNKFLAQVSPNDILDGSTPRLVDEWQEQPTIWNNVRILVDQRKKPNQFILTGSATIDKNISLHSGAGRFIVIDMSTMTWAELGYSNASVDLEDLLLGKKINIKQNPVELKTILSRMVIGGWPALIGRDERSSMDINRAYVDLLIGDDISRVSGVQRDKNRAMRLLQSLARNVAAPTDVSTLASDTGLDTFGNSDISVSRQTTRDYMDDLEKLMILVNQPSWNTHIRSSAALRTTPKRHLVDPSLVAAALGVSMEHLFTDLNFAGLLFESLVFHDISAYSSMLDATVSYYRDSYGNEVDVIVEKRSGEWAAFEVKLGDVDLDIASDKLLSFRDNLNLDKIKAPGSLNIIVGTGVGYTRLDGVNVIPLSTLGCKVI